MKNKIKALAAASLIALGIGSSTGANAAVIQLGFILDESGSIGAGNWNTIRTGLANAVSLIPVGGPDTYEVSVVKFSTNATASISNFLITDATQRGILSAQIAALSFAGGTTNYAAAFSTMTSVLQNSIAGAAFSYVNFATDGVQVAGSGQTLAQVQGYTQRDAMITAGIDNISIEGIGTNIDATDLQTRFCYPQPCDTTSPYNFPTQGFYIGVADAAGYAAAIGNKIRVVTGQPIPEPGTLVLLGLGALGLGLVRRRSLAAA